MPLLGMLWALARSPASAARTGGGGHSAGSPAPWHPAAPTLFLIDEGVRRLEASLRQEVSGHLGMRRGGSYANTRLALRAVVNLSYGVPPDSARKAAKIISGWIRTARQEIAEDDRPRPVPRAAGADPIACPYCDTYALRVVPRDARIWCINGECKDHDGERPQGVLDYDDGVGEGMIVWTDGRVTRHRDLA